ncbi:MAG: 30S ribosomal protein S9 [Methanonatronarchaeales archaeon]|nr:30S ribosomal protein S9 [Methanonatronarchaeales archaeon]
MKIINESGKRKTAVARSTVTKGEGRVRVNKVPLRAYRSEGARLRIREPLDLAGDVSETVDIDVNVEGGGRSGQADAVRTAIARGLWKFTGDQSLRDLYMEHDRALLINDVRQKEPKKYGGPGARARRQKSYR